MKINSKTPTKRILKAVKQVIQGGWTQNDFYNYGCHCLAGAVGQVMLGEPSQVPWVPMQGPLLRVVHALTEALPEGTLPKPGPNRSAFGRIYGFNDNPETTKADVLAVLDRAISHA